MHTGWISRDDRRRFPLDPLQRRAEVIEHYDRHGYPERAAYLRRVDEGPMILASLQAAATDPSSLLDATFVAIEWWAGDDAGRFAVTDFMVSGDDVVDLGFRLERALLLGLAARVNTRLQPFPRQLRRSPDYEVYHLVRASHEAINGSNPLPKWELSPPHRDGISSAHVMVCDLCSVVELTVMSARRCRLCAKHHALPEAMLAPITNPNLAWLITGYRQQHLHTCEVCGMAFFGNVDAKTCSARCRTARHRAAEQLAPMSDWPAIRLSSRPGAGRRQKRGTSGANAPITSRPGELLSTHQIEPAKTYWRNQNKQPGRWPSSPKMRLMPRDT